MAKLVGTYLADAKTPAKANVKKWGKEAVSWNKKHGFSTAAGKKRKSPARHKVTRGGKTFMRGKGSKVVGAKLSTSKEGGRKTITKVAKQILDGHIANVNSGIALPMKYTRAEYKQALKYIKKGGAVKREMKKGKNC